MGKENKDIKEQKRIKNRPSVFIVDSKEFKPKPVLTKEYIQECVEVSRKLRKDKTPKQEVDENNTDLII